jgi:hypothetical protein
MRSPLQYRYICINNSVYVNYYVENSNNIHFSLVAQPNKSVIFHRNVCHYLAGLHEKTR